MPSLRASHLVIAGSVAFAAALLAIAPGALDGRVGSALDDVRAASPLWLAAGIVLLGVVHTANGLAWRAALGACGTTTSGVDAVARYSIGSGVNAVTPMRLGSAVRIGLFARLGHIPGAIWQVGGAATATAALRGAWFALLVATAAATGALPWWPVAALGGLFLGASGTAFLSRRIRVRSRAGHALDAFRELGRSPRALATVAACTCAALLAKVAAAVAVAAAVGVEHPLVAGMLVVPAIELAAILPVTPGNVGIATAAIAFALESHGVAAHTALAAGIAYGAIEPLAALAMGGLGAMCLCGPRLVPSARLVAAAAGALVTTGLVGATLLFPLS